MENGDVRITNREVYDLLMDVRDDVRITRTMVTALERDIADTARDLEGLGGRVSKVESFAHGAAAIVGLVLLAGVPLLVAFI